jgi:hypothetical protein
MRFTWWIGRAGDGDDGAAIGVGDDAAVSLDALRVDLRAHQWELCIHPECGGVVDDRCPGAHR